MGINLPLLIVKGLLQLLAFQKRLAFIEACKNPQRTQDELKKKILAKTLMPFPSAPTTFRDYEHKKNLTQEPVTFYETTSGSIGAKKEIPYTRSLLKSFENMFLLWSHDLVFHSGLKLQSGKFFMSVSPQIGERSKDDRQYLSPALQLLLSPFLVSNPNEHQGETSHDFLMKVSQDLLKARELEVISIWSPTYFLSLLSFMENHRKELRLPEEIDWKKIWPQLKLISLWDSAQAEAPAKRLQSLFPHVRLQGKGLLSTEAPVTLPWSEAQGQVPLLTETYLEFLNQQGEILGLHELQLHERYIVLTSQFNGFLRYNTKDEVEVTGFYFKTPLLKFLGRTGHYSDLAGEKLSEHLLREQYSFLKGPFLFLPDTSETLPCYILVVEESSPELEGPLLKNHHYELARKLGQLLPLQVMRVDNLQEKYLRFYQDQGMVLGDIKERILINDPSEAQRFLKVLRSSLPE